MNKHQSAYRKEANRYEIIREFTKFALANNLDIHKLAKYKREVRQLAKLHRDKLEQPITEEWRTISRPDGEGWTQYIIFEDKGETDNEIEHEVKGMERHNYSMYDCSGKPVTAWIHWNRTPAGIVVVHSIVLDV